MFDIKLFGTNLNLYTALFFFFLYSFFGWMFEVGYQTKKLKKFVNRGFLNGAICPIYGAGMVLMIILCNRIIDNWILVFLAAVFVPSTLEFITGITLQLIFKRKWWDYSDCKFNLFGFICLKFSLLWGVAGLLMIKLINPLVAKLIQLVPIIIGNYILIGFIVIFLIDSIITVIQSTRFALNIKFVEKLEALLSAPGDFIGEKISEQVDKVYNDYEKSRIRLFKRRQVQSYPRLTKNFKEKIKKAERQESNQ